LCTIHIRALLHDGWHFSSTFAKSIYCTRNSRNIWNPSNALLLVKTFVPFLPILPCEMVIKKKITLLNQQTAWRFFKNQIRLQLTAVNTFWSANTFCTCLVVDTSLNVPICFVADMLVPMHFFCVPYYKKVQNCMFLILQKKP
jgi:hypothetical protein